MRKKPNLTHLALETATVVVVLLELINNSIDLLSKVVNYDVRQIRNLPLLLSA